MRLRVLSLIGFFVLGSSFAFLLTEHSLLGRGPVSVGLQVAAVLLMLWSRLTFGRRSLHAGADPTAGGLETGGPYRYLRHPIYAAVLLFAWAGIAANLSLPSALAGLAVAAGASARIVAEEKLLLLRYPEYADYSRRTKRLIPYVL